ncbi:MAG: hypothetical protein ACK5WF_08125 [Cyclobacteriaceae bacterium]|jgi:small-conductance mechanosensitive channel
MKEPFKFGYWFGENDRSMTKKVFKKYVIFLAIYAVTIRLIGYYGLRLYYTFAENPKILPTTVQSLQSVLTAVEFTFNLFIMIMMAVDLKEKRLTDWLIILITFFNADIGIVLIIVWTFYKEWTKKYEAQH